MGNAIRINCFTNLDEYKREEWPSELPVVPQIGHRIRSHSGKRLMIVALCWHADGTLEVELHR